MNRLVLALVFACCLALATEMAPVMESVQARTSASQGPLMVLLGDGRRAFGNQFFAMADVYFHSGYYPTIFDARKQEGPNHLDVASHDEANGKEEKPDDDDSFMGKPRDIIERFGRNFIPTVHTHLQGEKAREILPWLKLAVIMDPKRIDAYVTAAYWLRTRLNKPDEAADFLRQGLHANPDSYEILLELGRIYFDNKKNPQVARNVWEEGLHQWRLQETAGKNPDPYVREELLGEMVHDDERSGDLKQLLADLEELKKCSVGTGSLEKYIEEVKAKLAKQR